MKVAQGQEGNKAKLYSEIVVKEAPKPRTIGAKIYNEIIVKVAKSKREIKENYTMKLKWKKPQNKKQ